MDIGGGLFLMSEVPLQVVMALSVLPPVLADMRNAVFASTPNPSNS